MSSVSSGFKQPLTRTFVQTQDDAGYNGGEWGPYLFYQSDIDTWITAQVEAGYLKVTGGAYIITSGNFSTVINNLSASGNRIAERRTIIDMGKEYIIGNTTEARLIVLRKVRLYGSASEGGADNYVGYILTENNTSASLSGRFQVKVARV